MDVKVTPSDTEPGASVELNLEAKPNSYIGLLGVDQSVTLLKTGNDIEYVSQLYLTLPFTVKYHSLQQSYKFLTS